MHSAMQINMGRTPAGEPVLMFTSQQQVDPLALLRNLKKGFPDLWQQVHLEIIIANPPQVDERKILNANGNINP